MHFLLLTSFCSYMIDVPMVNDTFNTFIEHVSFSDYMTINGCKGVRMHILLLTPF